MSAETVRLSDSHCHLAEAVLHTRLPEVLAEAAAAGVGRFVVPAVHQSDWATVAQLVQLDAVSAAAFGVHPWFADSEWTADSAAALDRQFRRYADAWVGEIGLDFYRAADETQRAAQQTAFRTQLALAQQYRRPIVLHNVRAGAAVWAAVRDTGFTQGGIAHAFSGSLEEARQFVRHGFFIGIGMMLLNPNAKKLRRTAAELPLEYLLLETDSPFMLRDAVNSPANVRCVAETLAQLRGITLAEVAVQTERNLTRLLNRERFQAA
ncbi:MAG: TatD family hydrolase [Conchiformibius sp.]|nr:TatD family hydrolase [Conchiformibius sp.]